jgi:3-hydroxyacyl-[acyl-carrier-protein] dehydratase
MLIKDFYTIDSCSYSQDNNNISANITINPNHDVYKGHFPGQPVVPGVIQLQILRELCEKEFNKPLSITGSSVIKYINMIIPDKNPKLAIDIAIKEADGTYKIDGKILDGDTVFLKAKLTLSNS